MSDKLQSLLEDLKKDYLAALPIKIQRINDLLHIEEWDLIQEEFHKLKGTGKTYGFPEVSTLGEYMETLFKRGTPDHQLAAKTAVNVLSRILTARENNRAFDIAVDEDYLKLQKM